MSFVVTEACIQCKYTDCVQVCPVDCFQEGPNFLVIDPKECIDCGVCVPECPVEAIYDEDDLPPDQKVFIEINAQIAASGQWPVLTQQKAPMAEHEHFKAVKAKLHLLDRQGA